MGLVHVTGVHPLLLLSVSLAQRLLSRHQTLAPARASTVNVISESLGPGMWPEAEAAGNETSDAGQALARASLAVVPIIRVAGPGVWPGAVAGGPGNKTPDAGLAPARISFGPTQRRGSWIRNRGNGDLAASQSPHLAEPPGHV